MVRKPQQEFNILGMEKPKDRFGGSLLKGNPKTRRPLESKLPIHLILRARVGGMRKPQAFVDVDRIIRKVAEKHGVTIYKYANVGNHLHLLIKIRNIPSWARFIRELTGRIAQFMREFLGLTGESFWLVRPFTRIVRSWKTCFQIAKEYIQLNVLEAEGFINRRETKTLRDYRAIFDG